MSLILPIITYHRIVERNSLNREKHSVMIDQFRKQMETLKEDCFEVVRLHDVLRRREVRTQENTKAVAITFDDGHDSDYLLAYGILKELGLTATFFITTDWIGKSGYMTRENLLEIKKGGMSIQSHSVSHSSLPNLNDEELTYELARSRDYLSEVLGAPPDFLSVPHGFVSKRVMRKAMESGYRGVCTSAPGLNRIRDTNFIVLSRLMVTRKTSYDTFLKLINSDEAYTRKSRVIYQMKAGMRKVIGNSVYQRVWRALAREL